MNKQDLLDLKDDIDTAKEKVSRLEGRKDHLYQQLSDEWECGSVEKAQEKSEDVKAHIQELDDQIEEETTKIQEQYDV